MRELRNRLKGQLVDDKDLIEGLIIQRVEERTKALSDEIKKLEAELEAARAKS